MIDRAAAFGAAWLELIEVLPDVDGTTVKITLRRKHGQWLAQVANVNATGRTEADALRGVVSIIAKRANASHR